MEPLLTIVASHRDRLDLNSNITKWYLKSLFWQDDKRFEVVIADGGSKNYEELKQYFESLNESIKIRMVQHKIGDAFERALLNNVGIRNSNTQYVMCSDVDMLYGKQFVSTLISNLSKNSFVESRTMYLKQKHCDLIYSGKLDPYNNLDECKIGRLKKRTTAGGCECTSMENWNKLTGFSERFVGWGSEDYELLLRVGLLGLNLIWMGDSIKDIMLFHQAHSKNDTKKDLQYQEENKKLLYNVKSYRANLNGWGGKL